MELLRQRLAAPRRGFGRYAPESEDAVCEPQCTRNVALSQLMERFSRYLKCPNVPGEPYGALKMARKALAGLPYTPGDVLGFSVAWAAFEDHPNFHCNAGIFMGAALLCGPEGAYTIRTTCLSDPLPDLGYWNTRDLTIIGDAGFMLGHLARRGSRLTLRGNAGDSAGLDMTGGEIIIEGNCGDRLGMSMKNGLIRVIGDAGQYAGFDMRGGKIELEGGFGCISRTPLGGSICHMGKRVS